MTVFDYIILTIAFLHFVMTCVAINNTPKKFRPYIRLTKGCNIWWIAPLIVAYRVFG